MIGLGMMGGPMAGHLLRHKFPVFGHDLDPARCREFARRGGTVCPDTAAVARQAKIVIVMVGYDHEASRRERLRMERREISVLKRLGIGNPYL